MKLKGINRTFDGGDNNRYTDKTRDHRDQIRSGWCTKQASKQASKQAVDGTYRHCLDHGTRHFKKGICFS